jgi:thiol-disulfide isomerase/thioredoxin
MRVKPFKLLVFTLLIFSTCISFSQNVKIKGKAHASHNWKAVNLFEFSDLVTYTRSREATDTIDKDGYFELDLQVDHTQLVLIQVENLVAKLYIRPDYVYGITFPEKDPSIDIRGDAEIPVEPGIISADTTELNTMVIDFNKVYNKVFESASTQFINKTRIFQKLDTLKFICSWRYKKNKDPYFKNYVEYNIAELNSNASRSKTFLLSNFISNKPVQYSHYEYMAFFNAFFKGYMEAYSSSQAGENIYHVINSTGQYKEVYNFIKNDPALTNDTLRELVILKNLWDYYYSPQFDNGQVVAIVEQIFETTKIPEHKKIAGNILQIAYKLSIGSAAPDFASVNKAGQLIGIKDLKGRYIYLNFFSTKSINSMKEMPKIADLVKKYGDKVSFVSICTDDSLKSYKDYLRSNPKYNWTILWNGAKSGSAYEKYNLKGVPAFFFINQYGNLAHSPAKSPTQGFEYKLKALFKPKKSTNKIGIH